MKITDISGDEIEIISTGYEFPQIPEEIGLTFM